MCASTRGGRISFKLGPRHTINVNRRRAAGDRRDRSDRLPGQLLVAGALHQERAHRFPRPGQPGRPAGVRVVLLHLHLPAVGGQGRRRGRLPDDRRPRRSSLPVQGAPPRRPLVGDAQAPAARSRLRESGRRARRLRQLQRRRLRAVERQRRVRRRPGPRLKPRYQRAVERLQPWRLGGGDPQSAAVARRRARRSRRSRRRAAARAEAGGRGPCPRSSPASRRGSPLAVASPPLGWISGSASPWITTVGAVTFASAEVRSPEAMIPASWRMNPAG